GARRSSRRIWRPFPGAVGGPGGFGSPDLAVPPARGRPARRPFTDAPGTGGPMREYLGHLPRADPLYDYLQREILPQLGYAGGPAEYRVFRLGERGAVYL